MVFNTTRTIYSLKLQTALLTGAEYETLPNTTLNEKFSILPNYVITGTYPRLNCYVLGVGGNPIIENTAIDLKRGKHRATDGALFKHLPFIIRRTDDDISDELKQKYRLRKVENINGIDYIVYYAKVLDKIDFTNTIFQVNSDFGNNFIGPYDTTNDPTILNPTPLLDLDITKIKGSYVLNMCKVLFVLEDWEIEELKNSMSIMYPGETLTSISEIGLCSGIDIDYNGYKESVKTQINFFTDMNLDLQLLDNLKVNNRVEFYLELGGMEPLYKG